MFELVGLGAVVVCCLKGRWLRGLILLTVGIAVMATAIALAAAMNSDISGPVYLLAGLGTAGFGIVLALPVPEPGSWWDRFSAVDAEGTRLITVQTRSQRIRRAILGAVLGLVQVRPQSLSVLQSLVKTRRCCLSA